MMKTQCILAAVCVLSLAPACSTESGHPAPYQGSKAALQLSGKSRGDFRSALMAISDVTVLADGQRLPVSIERAAADLARADQRLDARFQVPPDARNIEVSLTLDDWGAFAQGPHAGSVDTRGTRIRFVARAEDLRRSGVAKVELDLGRSIVPEHANERVLLPHFDVLTR